MPNHPQLILVDPSAELCKAFTHAFAGLSNVEVVHGYFEHLPAFDCMVSAANSFGLMDGGVDAAITRFFGVQLQDRVQQHIIEHYHGEQLVGTSFVIATRHTRHPYLAHTPTMRIPMPITNTDNVYRAMWAMLLAIAQHNQSEQPPIRIIACPGLGTATGRVPAAEAARQMAAAYRHFLNPPVRISWDYAHDRQQAVRYGGDSRW
jgi:O-acetyl-ADP-ribose deacetylase (regulator of RNase III)